MRSLKTIQSVGKLSFHLFFDHEALLSSWLLLTHSLFPAQHLWLLPDKQSGTLLDFTRDLAISADCFRRLLITYSCSLDTSASSALQVLMITTLCKSTYLLTYLLTYTAAAAAAAAVGLYGDISL